MLDIYKECKVLQVHKAPQEHKVQQVLVHRAPPAPQELKEQQVLKAPLEHKAYKAYKAYLVPLVLRVQLERPALKALQVRELKAPQVHKALLATQVPKAPQVMLELKAPQVMLELKER